MDQRRGAGAHQPVIGALFSGPFAAGGGALPLLTISTTGVAAGATGVVARLSSVLAGTFDEAVDVAGVTIAAGGDVSFTAGLAAGATRTVNARVTGTLLGVQIIATRAFELTGVAAAVTVPVVTAIARSYADTSATDTFAALTGAIAATQSPASFGIDGGTGGATITRIGVFGTLTVTAATGAYSYAPDSAAINAVETGAPTDAFTVTATNAAGTGVAPLVVTVNGVVEAVGAVPVNVIAPSIDGTPIDGTAWSLNVGGWTDAASFEVEVRTVEATPVVLLARQAATGATAGAIAGTVGKTLVLRVWATGPGGTTLASSANFGPVTAAGDTLVLALAFATTDQSLPTAPYPFTAMIGTNTQLAIPKQGATTLTSGDPTKPGIYPIPNPNIGMAGLSFGFNAAADISTGNAAIAANATLADGRLRGRWPSANAGVTTTNMRIDLPGAGVYRLYAGLGTGSVNTPCNIGVWEGTPIVANSRYQMGPIGDIDATTSIVDISGAVPTIADWAAATSEGRPGMGSFVEITVGAGAYLTIGRSTNASSGTPQICTIAVFRKA